MKKRLFGILLSFAMMLTMMPVLELSQTAYADVDVIHVGSTYQSGGKINFGPEEVWIIAGNSPSRYTGSWNLAYIEYYTDSQHHFTLSTGDKTFNLYLPDEDSRPPWGVAVTGGNGTSSKPFILTVLHEEPVSYNCWVGGTQVTSANKDDVFGDGKVSYTPAPDDETPATLTLNNYTYNSGVYYYSAIYANENLILELEGTNNVDSTLVEGNDNAIFVNDQLNVQGEGSLDAKGKRYGIYAYKGLTIEGCNVIARSTETTEGEKIYRGISSGNKGDDITIKNATVKANAVVGNAIDSGGNVIIENSTVEAHSTNHIGIYSFEGTNVEIKYGSNVIASGGDKAIDGTVKNAIAGTGWTDTTGTQGKADIAINSEGQKLETYKKVQFPAVPEPVKESTITYDLNGGTLDGQTGIVTTTVENGKVITLPAPARDGYTFDYWEGSKYNAGDRYTVNGDHTFKAIWKTGAGGNGSKGGSSKKGVNTGDENTLGAWIVLLAAALAGTTGMVFARKRRND